MQLQLTVLLASYVQIMTMLMFIEIMARVR